MMEPSSTDLIAPVHIGSVGAQTAGAYERHAAEVNGYLVRTVRDVEAAADILADTFTRLLIEERRGRWPDNPRAWLYRVATNLAMSRGRHLQVVARVDRAVYSSTQDHMAASPDVEVLRRERQTDLDRALATLGPDARAALLLASQGFDGATIALTIGRTETATRTLMFRSRARMRELLREDNR